MSIAVLSVAFWVWRAKIGPLHPLGRIFIAVVAMSAIVVLGTTIAYWVGRQIWSRSIPSDWALVPLFLVGLFFLFGSGALAWAALVSASIERLRAEIATTPRYLAFIALQALVASYLVFLIVRPSGSVLDALLGALTWPILGPELVMGRVTTHFTFLREPLLVSVVVAGFFAILHQLYLGRLRAFWPTTFAIVGFASLYSLSERQFHTRLERAALLLGPECVTADSFFNSIRRRKEFQTDLHAQAIKNGDLYAWSFATSDFYKVPESAVGNVSTHPGSSFSLPFPTCR